MPNEFSKISVVGGGLAGSECALQLAEMGFDVQLYEMRGKISTPAHKTNHFAELVCSNSFGSLTDYSAPGQLKREAFQASSFVLNCALEAKVPAGMALGVDREIFARKVSEKLCSHPKIEIINDIVESLDQVPRPAVIATGPLTHPPLAQSMAEHFDSDFLYFFDAIAPIIDADSIDYGIVWEGDRWGKGNGDYLNCPLDKEQYLNLVKEINLARKIEPKDFEKETPYFESCMPIEVLAERGEQTLRYGALSPKGLDNPKTGKWAYATVQLRQENKEKTAYNMVGFQTKMAYPEQKRIFSQIPGLENADFLKLGSMHRNLYIDSPKKLNKDLSSQKDPMLFFAGQITGVEGYFESTCIGLLVAHFLKDKLKKNSFNPPPRKSALGSLLNAITEEKENFQPTNINFGLFPCIKHLITKQGKKFNKREARDLKIQVAQESFLEWWSKDYSTVTDFAKLRGWSTSCPNASAT